MALPSVSDFGKANVTIKRVQNRARMALSSVSDFGKANVTIKRAQNRARMALPSVSDFGKANVTMMLMATIVFLYVRTRTLYI